MRHPPSPDSDGQTPRARTRGAIRTHLGRKRSGPRGRPLGDETLARVQQLGEMQRSEQERLFDRLMGRFQSLFDAAGEKSASAFDSALENARDALVTAGEMTAGSAERLRQFLRRDLLHRDHPAMTFRSGEITTSGTLSCEGCGWTIIADRTTLLPLCPQCGDAAFRKSD